MEIRIEAVWESINEIRSEDFHTFSFLKIIANSEYTSQNLESLKMEK